MAELEQKDKGKGGKGRQKKMSVHLDFTPMVDMNMLLITFFMLCTSLSKPQTMEISMPTNDKITEEEQNKVQASRAITLLLTGDDKVFYYFGEPDYDNYESIQPTTYDAGGLRAMLIGRNADVMTRAEQLKARKLAENMPEEEFQKQLSEIRQSKASPVVIIKSTDDSSYKNLVDALDEMHICNISKYAIVDLSEGDKFLLKNYETAGELTKNIDRSKMQTP